jgi:DNA-binding transcriptional LysR family regulator
MLNLYQLKIFQVVASEGGIGRAANALYLSQPAVSQHIKALEHDLGVELFERKQRGVTLTPAGETLLDYAQNLLRLSLETRHAVQQAAETNSKPLPRVQVGATPGIGAFLLPHWIQQLYARQRQCTLSIKIAGTIDLAHAVANQQLAFAITGDHLDRDVIMTTPLWNEETVIIVGQGHAWWGQEMVHASALADETFIMRNKNSAASTWELQTLARFGVYPQAIMEFTAPAAITQAVKSNMGVALLPYFTVRQEVSEGKLHPVRLHEGTCSRTLNLLWSSASLTIPEVPMLLRFLLEYANLLAVRPQEPAQAYARAQFKQSPELRALLNP